MKNLFLLALIFIAGFSCDSTKGEMMNGNDYPTPSAKLTVTGNRVAGNELTITIEAPASFMQRFEFVANFGSGQSEIRIPNPNNSNTIKWTYDEPGLYTMMGYAWNNAEPFQGQALSDGEELIIRP